MHSNCPHIRTVTINDHVYCYHCQEQVSLPPRNAMAAFYGSLLLAVVVGSLWVSLCDWMSW